jgi:hypothetical protein
MGRGLILAGKHEGETRLASITAECKRLQRDDSVGIGFSGRSLL